MYSKDSVIFYIYIYIYIYTHIYIYIDIYIYIYVYVCILFQILFIIGYLFIACDEAAGESDEERAFYPGTSPDWGRKSCSEVRHQDLLADLTLW